jgi:hypothetical protein
MALIGIPQMKKKRREMAVQLADMTGFKVTSKLRDHLDTFWTKFVGEY